MPGQVAVIPPLAPGGPAIPAIPAIPAAALASVLTRTAMDTPTGTSVVPATALAHAVAQEAARPSSAGPAVPIADIERLLAGATALATPVGSFSGPPTPAPAGRSVPMLPQRAPLDPIQASPAATATLSWPPPQPAAPFQLTAGLDGDSPTPVVSAPVMPGELTSLAELVGELIGDEPPRDWVDLENSDHMDRLTAKIYDRLSDRLRRDVLVQRERSGKLMDSW
jgi:hypothetical protein